MVWSVFKSINKLTIIVVVVGSILLVISSNNNISDFESNALVKSSVWLVDLSNNCQKKSKIFS